MPEMCAACGDELPADGSGCSCRVKPRAESTSVAWGGLDFDPARERQARAARAAASVVARMPTAPLPDDDLPAFTGGLFESPTQPLQLAHKRSAARPASQPVLEPLTQPRNKPVRPASSPLAAGRGAKQPSEPLHPALRGARPQPGGGGGLASGAVAARAGERSRPISKPLELDRERGPALGLGDEPPVNENGRKQLPSHAPERKAVSRPAPAAAAHRQQRVAAMAAFGPAPSAWLQCITYGLRVQRRKRALQAQLDAHVRARQQLEGTAEQAFQALGEALVMQASDPSLAVLAPLLRAVNSARDGASQPQTSHQNETDAARKREFAALSQAADARRALVAPLEQHAREAEQRVLEGNGRVRELEERMASIVSEQKNLQQQAYPAARARGADLEAVRQESAVELQQLRAELPLLTDQLTRLRADVTQHTAAVAELQEQQARLLDVVERDDARVKDKSEDSPGSGYRAALKALAQGALRENLTQRVSLAATQAIAAQAPLPSAHEHDLLLRAALQSYDRGAYRRGMRALAVVAVLLLLTALGALTMTSLITRP